jgi:hypothetical protein
VFVHCPQSVLAKLLEQGAIRVLLLDFQILVYSRLTVVQLDLVVDQLLVLVGLKTVQFKIEVETRHWTTTGLIVQYMQLLHVRVRQSLFNSDTL